MLILFFFAIFTGFIGIDLYKSGKYGLFPAILLACSLYGLFTYISYLICGSDYMQFLKIITILPMVFFGLAGLILIIDGIAMLKYERFKFSNQLSLYGGLSIITVLLISIFYSFKLTWIPVVLLILSTMLMILITGFIISVLLFQIKHKKSEDKGFDFIIILGTGLVKRRFPSPLLVDRLEKGFELAEKNPDAIIIATGGRGKDEDLPESLVMGEYLIKKGISPDKIKLEAQSTNTLENLTYSQGIIGGKAEKYTAAVVSNNFHLLRASFLSKDIGLFAEFVGSKTAWYYYINCMLREFIALIVKSKGFILLYLGAVIAELFMLFLGLSEIFQAQI